MRHVEDELIVVNGTDAEPKGRVMVTGAELVKEARDLLKAHRIEALYAPAYATPQQLADMARDNAVDAILVRQGKIEPLVINASPRLKVIAKHGSGVDNIDLAAATQRNVPVLRALAANAQSVAELAISLTVSLMKDVLVLDRAVKSGGWPKTSYVGRDLAGAVFAVIGFGEIGQRTATLAKALGMSVIAYDPFAQDRDGMSVSRDLDAVITRADVVSLHCPLTKDTQHLFNAERLARMKPSAFLVNTARGAVVDETALVEALQAGTIAGAALDSFEEEPPAKDSILWSLPNLIATPHVGGASRSALRNMAMQSAQHIITVLEGGDYERAALANKDLINAA